MKNLFIHHVFFWLKNPEDAADKAALVAGLTRLSKVNTIQQFHIGEPAATNRDVIENSYSISWFTIFSNASDQNSYQTDPIHLQFIKDCSHLWLKVIVYDTLDVK